jgi:bifunctional DNA-binding transcriptional regulator/antitoxin component of YhaV-PrlF toxin-antitoxin module
LIAWFRRRLVNTNENAPCLFLTLVLSLFLTSAHASEPEIADSMRDGECEVIVSFLNSLIAKHPTDKLQVIEDVTASVDMISIGEKDQFRQIKRSVPTASRASYAFPRGGHPPARPTSAKSIIESNAKMHYNTNTSNQTKDTAMTTLTVTARGQVTFRKEVLQHLGIKPGEKIELDLLPDGRGVLRAARSGGTIDGFLGLLAGKTKKVATIEELDAAAALGWAGQE